MNLFALEPLLIARLQAVLPPEAQVLTAPYMADLAELETRGVKLPAVYVMHLDGVPIEAPHGSRFGLRLVQRWAVVAAVLERSVQPQATAARSQAGELGEAIVQALHGYLPVTPGKALALARVLFPLYRAGGLQLLPLIFTYETPRVCG